MTWFPGRGFLFAFRFNERALFLVPLCMEVSPTGSGGHSFAGLYRQIGKNAVICITTEGGVQLGVSEPPGRPCSCEGPSERAGGAHLEAGLSLPAAADKDGDVRISGQYTSRRRGI